MRNLTSSCHVPTPNIPQKKESTPWWLFLNLLALDAPVIAIVWQHFLGKTLGIEISIEESAVLFFTVWFIYLLDHFFDSRKIFNATPRHLFVAKNQRLTITLIGLTFTISMGLSLLLSKSLILAGYILASLICVYLVFVHANIPNLKSKTNSKELLVGIGFGIGVGLPVIISDVAIETWLPAIILFCLLCWMNCRLIDHVESERTKYSITDVFLLLTMFFCMLVSKKILIIAALITIMALIMINLFAGSKNKHISRVLADVSLLSPWIAWTFP